MKTIKRKCSFKTKRKKDCSFRIAIITCIMLGLCTARSQSVITFDNPPLISGARSYRNYYENGMWFRVQAPLGKPLYDDMYRMGIIVGSIPHNGTPHMEFAPSGSYGNYVVFSLLSSNTFGLGSVDLADNFSPSSINRSIEFNGYKLNGSVVTNIFTTPGGGATNFQTFNFSTDFNSDLIRVEMPISVWAMDNLVIVPEPATTGLMVAGLMAFAGLIKRKRHQCTKTTVT